MKNKFIIINFFRILKNVPKVYLPDMKSELFCTWLNYAIFEAMFCWQVFSHKMGNMLFKYKMINVPF